MVLFQLQVVATGCSVGDNDIRWTSWGGYKLVMAAMQHGNVTVGTTLNEGLPLKLVRSNVYTCFLIIRIIIISITGKYNCLIDLCPTYIISS